MKGLKKKHNQDISQYVGRIETFRKKLFSECRKKNDIMHFSSCRELLPDDNSTADLSIFAEKENIFAEFKERFADFDRPKPNLGLFNNLMEFAIETQSSEFQLVQELCELQPDPSSLTKKNENRDSFWVFVSREFPKFTRLCTQNIFKDLKNVYETTFSVMKQVKSKTRNMMNNDTLDASFDSRPPALKSISNHELRKSFVPTVLISKPIILLFCIHFANTRDT